MKPARGTVSWDDRKRYMYQKYLTKETGGDDSSRKDRSESKERSSVEQHSIKNLNIIQKNHLEKIYGGRIDAIDRRGQNLLKKYHHEVEVIRKNEDKKSLVENRGKEDYRDIYERKEDSALGRTRKPSFQYVIEYLYPTSDLLR